MIRKILFTVFSLALFSFAWHAYYVTITEVEYDKKSKAFEISVKFIGHDLEKALAAEGVPDLFLGTPKEHENANDYLVKYIQKKFFMVVDNQKMAYKFIGKEINNDDFIYVFVESNAVERPKNVKIINTLLIDLFEKQANTVYLKVGKETYTYSLNKEKVSEAHDIK